MEIKLIIDPKFKKPEIHICHKEAKEEALSLYEAVNTMVNTMLTAYDEDGVCMLISSEIIRVYTQNQKVMAATAKGTYQLRQRLYEIEEILDGSRFLRISNSEIVNIKKIRRMDTSITGTIKMYMDAGMVTYVSRRYVSKIKKALGI